MEEYAVEEERDIFAELVKSKAASAPKPKVRGDVPPSIETDDETDEAEGQLTVDVFQDADNIYVQSAVAGVSPDDLEIHITKESVTIRGSRERAHTVAENDFFYQECFWGSFSRSIVLPQEVDSDASAAAFKNGVLTITMPKLGKKKRARGVKVTVG
jgi:HSP20 family protein